MSATPKVIIDISCTIILFERNSYQSQLALLDLYRDETEVSTDTKENEIDYTCILCRAYPCLCQKQLL
jgi:hypothetical protein